MSWDVTYLAVHIAALAGVVMLWRGTPDGLQRIVLAILGASMLVYIGSDIVVLSGEKKAWVIRLVASRAEHAAVLLYIFRQFWVESGACRYLKSLR